MDEFFDFEGATNEMQHSQTEYPDNDAFNFDINVALADPGSDEDAFLCPAHFTQDAPPQQIFTDHRATAANRIRAGDPFIFPSWIDVGNVTPHACAYCLESGFHCTIIKAGIQKNSCTSCVALERACSFDTPQLPEGVVDEDFADLENFSIPQKGAADETAVKSDHVSASDLQALSEIKEPLSGDTSVKSGTRFSREALRVLRAWLTTHHRLPYPTDEDKDKLAKQTGLTKTQISNWIANARRRGKVRAPRTISPGPQHLSYPIDIPRRRDTPIPREMEGLNPLERWKESPPEHEPASVSAIANALSSSTWSPGQHSPRSVNGDSDSAAAKSLCNASSVSGFGTSGSSGDSLSSAFSYDSRVSLGSLTARGRRRRGQRQQIKKPVSTFITAGPPQHRKFQCTFCTESFKTKHDWQRHEKSLHLSLERWICAPHGPTAWSIEKNKQLCAFCDASEPDDSHFESHDYGSCVERTVEDRTFYRKDHLRQHLLLIHDSRFNSWSMNAWKVETPSIKSRCGFCPTTMDTWTARVDHLAKHFKSGKNMSEWTGDWGFEPHVLSIVENAMPPYLIDFDRNTPRPFKASKENPEGMRQPYDLVKMGLVDFINEKVASGGTPSDEELLNEARQIYRSLDGAAKGSRYRGISWFRDLFMTGTSHARPKNFERANLMRDQSSPECGLGKCCLNEMKLKDFVIARVAIGSPPTTCDLQNEACRILTEAEATSTFPCEAALSWFLYLITSTTDWLHDFRRRVSLPLESELSQGDTRVANELDDNMFSAAHLRNELVNFVNSCSAMNLPQPSDDDLKRQARMIIFGVDELQYTTQVDDPKWLQHFKRYYDHRTHASEDRPSDFLPHLSEPTLASDVTNRGPRPETFVALCPRNTASLHWDISPSPANGSAPSGSAIGKINTFNPMANTTTPFARLALPLYPQNTIVSSSNSPALLSNPNSLLIDESPADKGTGRRRYFFSDANCYRRLMYELSRFVASCLSPNNPDPHIPTDEEIQRQARWILYDSDDPWNQTAADNEEWMRRFKRDVGLLSKDENEGLGMSGSLSANLNVSINGNTV